MTIHTSTVQDAMLSANAWSLVYEPAIGNRVSEEAQTIDFAFYFHSYLSWSLVPTGLTIFARQNSLQNENHFGGGYSYRAQEDTNSTLVLRHQNT